MNGSRRPDPLSMGEVMQGSQLLAHLQKQVAQSRARFDAVAPLLPAALRAQVKPAGFEGGVWCLLCANAAVATKLRQLVPRLLAQLNAQQLPTQEISLKIQANAGVG